MKSWEAAELVQLVQPLGAGYANRKATTELLCEEKWRLSSCRSISDFSAWATSCTIKLATSCCTISKLSKEGGNYMCASIKTTTTCCTIHAFPAKHSR